MTLLLENISLTIGDVLLVKSFTISVEAGEIVTLMGPSGCGKSSLLAYIAGDLTSPMYGNGHVTLDGVDLIYLPPEQRQVGRLFQDDLLFPHLTVGENLLFGIARGSSAEAAEPGERGPVASAARRDLRTATPRHAFQWPESPRCTFPRPDGKAPGHAAG